MRTNKFLLMMLLAVFMVSGANAKSDDGKTDWSKVNFIDEYKVKFKIPGAMSKSLKSNPTFITDYTINNALRMKGSESNAKGTVHSEVHFGGIPQDKFQKMVQDLYAHFQEQLLNAGITLTDGEKEIQSKSAQKQLEKGKHLIGKASGSAYNDKAGISEGSIPGYGVVFVKEGVTFRPEGKITYLSTSKVPGTFYQKFASENEVNLISIGYYLTYASFDGGRGYKRAYLETQPVLSVNPVITLSNPKGTIGFITIGKGPFWGTGDWSLGLRETDLNQLEYFGLATSAEYAVEANADKYIEEVKDIVMNFQVDLVEALKAEL